MLVTLHRRLAGGVAVDAPGVAGSALWQGEGDPVMGVPIHVELEVPDEVAWDRIAIAPSGVDAPVVSDDELLLSLVLGVLTHVAWDAFTHGDGAVVQRVAWLREPLMGTMPAARVLQHLSTAIGLLVLAVCAVRAVAAWRRSGGRPSMDRSRVAAALVLVSAGAAAAVVGGAAAADDGLEAVMSLAAKDGGAAFALAGLVAAVIWWLSRARGRTDHGARQH